MEEFVRSDRVKNIIPIVDVATIYTYTKLHTLQDFFAIQFQKNFILTFGAWFHIHLQYATVHVYVARGDIQYSVKAAFDEI